MNRASARREPRLGLHAVAGALVTKCRPESCRQREPRPSLHAVAAAIAGLAIAATPGHARPPRPHPDGVLSDLMLLADIIAATLDGVDVDDDAVRAARFPERRFEAFDRDGDGEFMTPGAGFGVIDLDLAVLQFLHDPVDADGDGVRGFVEVECRFAGGPTLDPDESQTRHGTPDGAIDCDGDDLTNDFERDRGLDPLRPDRLDGDPDADGLTTAEELDLGTRAYEPDTDGDGALDGSDARPLRVDLVLRGQVLLFGDARVAGRRAIAFSDSPRFSLKAQVTP